MSDSKGEPLAPRSAFSSAFAPIDADHRVLALDVGAVRIGVALSCPLGQIAQPLCVVPRAKAPFARIEALCHEHQVATIIVGKPLRLSGDAGPAVRAIEGFVNKLSTIVALPIVWVDERMTTAAAERDMIALGARRDARREHIDKVAASLILQTFLDTQGRARQ